MNEVIELSNLLPVALIISAAYVVRGIAGFGSGLIAIPLLAFFLPLSVAVPIVVLLDYISSFSQGMKNREAVQWKEIVPLLPFTLIGVFTALFVFKYVDANLLPKIMGAFIIIFAVYTLLSVTVKSGYSRKWAVPAGSFGGLIGTLFGTGGPFYVIYLKLRGLDKTKFRATFATIFIMDGTVRLFGYLGLGFFNKDTLPLVALTIPVMALGLWVGGQIHTTLSQQAFQRAISVLLIASGFVLLGK
jgi:uncharacterized membrane protein YfcA